MVFRDEIGESLTLQFAKAANERKKKGLSILSLGLGEPDFSTPKEILEAVSVVLSKGSSLYSDPMGIRPLREKISLKLRDENKISANPENILVTAGAKQALQLILMSILEPEDEVIVISPYFVSFVPQILIAEPKATIRILKASKDDFSIDLTELEELVSDKTKVIILNSPNNPAGFLIEEKICCEIYKIAEKYGIYIISDEVYEKMLYSDRTHFSVGSVETMPEFVITINGFSKSHAMTGWRLGYACFPSKLFGKLQKLQQHINTNTCTFIQEAVSLAFHLDQTYLNNYTKKLKLRSEFVYSAISASETLSMVPPQAGFFAFLNIGNTRMDSNSFCSQLIEVTGVATTPGIAFGTDWDDHIRISFAVHDDQLREGINKLVSFAREVTG